MCTSMPPGASSTLPPSKNKNRPVSFDVLHRRGPMVSGWTTLLDYAAEGRGLAGATIQLDGDMTT